MVFLTKKKKKRKGYGSKEALNTLSAGPENEKRKRKIPMQTNADWTIVSS
jgi:hypothetical protein